MMKLMIAVFALTLPLSAHAESDWEYEGNKIHIFEMEPMSAFFMSASSEAILPEEYLNKGVFIRAMQQETEYPKSAEIIKERFTRRGIKVVNDLKEAGIAITFSGVQNTFMMTYSEVNYLIPEERRERDDEDGRIMAVITFDPVSGRSIIGDLPTIRPSGKIGDKVNMNAIVYKRMNAGITSGIVLRMVIDQWLDRFVPSASALHP